MKVRTVPRFMAMMGNNLNREAHTIELLFHGEDGEPYAIALAPDVIAPMLATISGLSNDLRTSLPDPGSLPTQHLDVKNFSVAMNPAGQIGWQLELTNGVAMVLRFERDQFEALDAKIASFRELLNRSIQ